MVPSIPFLDVVGTTITGEAGLRRDTPTSTEALSLGVVGRNGRVMSDEAQSSTR